MFEVQTFSFDKKGFGRINSNPRLSDWPVVYIIENGKEVYIGETTSVAARSRQHSTDEDRLKLERMHVILDEEYNKSATLDVEALLIQYIAAEGTHRLQNGNRGLVNHSYFDKERYRAKFESTIWSNLQRLGLVRKDLADIKNSEIFKYSPYKALTEDQLAIAEEILAVVTSTTRGTHIVTGGAGTGKSVLATYLVKALKDDPKTANLKIALVVSMSSLRGSIRNAFSHVGSLSESMVIGPSEVVNSDYDVLIVDEAHRLRQRKNIVNYRSHDEMNRKLGLGKYGTELDWILLRSKHQVLFYDEKQTIRPADVHAKRFIGLEATKHRLSTQHRVQGGVAYMEFVDNLFLADRNISADFDNFDFRIYEDPGDMVKEIKVRNAEIGLCRVVAGFAWPWTRADPNALDINLDGYRLKWNTRLVNWVNSPDAINEVGCIHTVQGYDLNYVGVIVGGELTFDVEKNQFQIQPDRYKDQNGWRGITDMRELERYIINIYKTLLTRGMKGAYVFVEDENLRDKLRQSLTNYWVPKMRLKPQNQGLVRSPITVEMVRIPLVGSAPCGNPLLGQENIQEYISVPKAKLKPGVKYFIVRAEGDSMDLGDIQDGDLLLCRYGEKGETGDKIIALLGGENVTVKEYGPRKNGIRLLLPRSSNKIHKPIKPSEGDSIQGIVQEILE